MKIATLVNINKINLVITYIKKIFQFYLEGFKNMKIGRRLWVIIAIKFVLFFVIMKILFFPNFLKENFSNDTQRAEYVLENLINKDNK